MDTNSTNTQKVHTSEKSLIADLQRRNFKYKNQPLMTIVCMYYACYMQVRPNTLSIDLYI